MIARLLRDDPMLRIQPVVMLMVAGLVALIGPITLGLHTTLQELSPDGTVQPDPEIGSFFLGMLAVQAIALSVIFSSSWARNRDGTNFLSRSRPMDLVLPIAPRASWFARLLAHILVILAPALTVWIVPQFMGFELGLLGLWKATACGLCLVLIAFGRAPGRATLSRSADGLVVALACLAALLALGNDQSALGGIASPGRFHNASEVLLGAALLYALQGYLRLPDSWPLTAQRPEQRSTASGAGGSSASQAGVRVGPGNAGIRWWSVTTATLGRLQMLVLCLAGVVIVPMFSAVSRSWVVVAAVVWLFIQGAQMVLARSRFLVGLPVSRGRVFAVALAPVLVGLALGCVALRGWTVWHDSARPIVTLDRQVERRADDSFDVWMDVIVPLQHWRLAANGEVPVLTSPSGEQLRPRAVHPMGLSFVTVYNPYDAPHGTSQAATAWQFSRALQAEHGVQLSAASLSERYLDTRKNGQVTFNSEQVVRNLDQHEADDGSWYGTMGTLVHDYPELAQRWDGRRAALPALAVILLSVIATLLLVRVRPGSLASKFVSAILPSLLMFSFAWDMWLALWFGAEHPEVLFAIAGEALLTWLPSSTVIVWAFTAAFAAGGFWLVARALDRAEVVIRDDQRRV
jgi:hypothetical protein